MGITLFFGFSKRRRLGEILKLNLVIWAGLIKA